MEASTQNLDQRLQEIIESHVKGLRDDFHRLLGELPIHTPAADAPDDGLAGMKDAVASIQNAEGQRDLAGRLLDATSTYAARAALILTREERCHGYDSRGFPLSHGDVSGFIATPGADDPLQAAVQRQQTQILPGESLDGSVLCQWLNGEAPGNVCLAPVVVGGTTVAVIYADSGLDVDTHLNGAAIEILASVTALYLERLRRVVTTQVLPEGLAAADLAQFQHEEEFEADSTYDATHETEEESAHQDDAFADEEASLEAGFSDEAEFPAAGQEQTAPDDLEAAPAAAPDEFKALDEFSDDELHELNETLDDDDMGDLMDRHAIPNPKSAPVVPEVHDLGEIPEEHEPATFGADGDREHGLAAVDTDEVDPDAQATLEAVDRALDMSSPEADGEPEVTAADTLDEDAFETELTPEPDFSPAPEPAAAPPQPSMDAGATVRMTAPVIPDTPQPEPPAAPAVTATMDDGPANEDAQRFARLLVSEIVLYNEAQLKAAQKSGNIYGELQEAIDRSREAYHERFEPDLTGYFDAELVETLALGNASLMGPAFNQS